MKNEVNNPKNSFSLNEIAKPKFDISQIQVDNSEIKTVLDLPKITKKLIVGRRGKVGFS